MKIAVIGTGNIGGGLGRLWAKKHQVMFGSRDPEKAKELAGKTGPKASGGSIAEAAGFGEIIVLAVPYTAAAETLKACGNLDGKILLDCTNPLNSDMSGLLVGHTSSAGEEIAKMAKGAKVVKGLNTIFANVHRSGNPDFRGQVPSVFYCGDDKGAKEKVAKLIGDAGYEPIDAGPLKNARYVEPYAMLLIQVGSGIGWDIAPKLLRR
ncbi:MAG: NADPH-dependent F420 reductase [Candidatus Micrarchaeota archaeon]